MGQQDSAGRRRYSIPGLLGRLFGCVLVATVAAVAVDQYQAAAHRRGVRDGLPAADRSAMPPPNPRDWRVALLTPGTPAPPVSLADVRTGRRVSLSDYRGRGPVVLLLSSFG